MLSTGGTPARPFASGQDFLDSLDHLEPGCILLDIRMPGISGVEVMEELDRRRIEWPVVVMTGHGEVSLAVQTMKLGAIDFLEKPFDEESLRSCIDRAFALIEENAAAAGRKRDAVTRIEKLTPRERDVLQGLLAGCSNKVIAHRLGISLRTAEMHRANLMQRLGAKSLAEVIQLGADAGVEPL